MRRCLRDSLFASMMVGLTACAAAPDDDVVATSKAPVTSAGVCGTTNSKVGQTAGKLTQLRVADLNRDGLLDLVGSSESANVVVQLGLPRGGFGPMAQFPVASDLATDLDLGDLNGDGVLDVAVALGYDLTNVQVLFGKGDGTFNIGPSLAIQQAIAGQQFGLGQGASHVTVGDFDNDGVNDFISSNEDVSYTFMRGIGGGAFAAPAAFALPFGNSPPIASADLDRDGKLDLVWNGGYFPGKGNGTFGANRGWPTRNNLLSAPVVADFDGDLILDVVGEASFWPNGDALVFLHGKGDGTFSAPAQLGTFGSVDTHGISAADVDGDGRLDVSLGHDQGLSLLFGNGNGTFGRRQDLKAALGTPANIIAAAPGRVLNVASTAFESVVDVWGCGK